MVRSASLVFFLVTSVLAADEERPLVLDQSQEFSLRLSAFCEKHCDDLAAIFRQQDKSLLLGAYWRYLNRTKNFGDFINAQDILKQRNQFIGALAALAGEEPPQWWQDSLMAERLVMTPDSRDEFWHYWKRNGEYIESRDEIRDVDYGDLGPGVEITVKTKNELRFEVGSQEFVLKQKALTALTDFQSKHYCALIGIRLDGRNYVFLFPPKLTRGGCLLQVDDEGELLWTQEVWCHGESPQWTFGAFEKPEYIGKGPWDREDKYHYAELTTVADRVIVYGAGHSGAYVEALDVNRGTSVFRFSTHTAHPAFVLPDKVPAELRTPSGEADPRN